MTTEATIICHPQVLRHYIKHSIVTHFGYEFAFHPAERFSRDKVWQTLLCLLICSNSMLYCARTFFCWRYIKNFLTSSRSLQYLDLGLSPVSSRDRLFKPLLLNLNLFDCESQQQYIMLHRQIIYVQRSSSLSSPGSRLSCFLCLAQQLRGKKFVVELAENASVQFPLCKEFHSFFFAGRIQS